MQQLFQVDDIRILKLGTTLSRFLGEVPIAESKQEILFTLLDGMVSLCLP